MFMGFQMKLLRFKDLQARRIVTNRVTLKNWIDKHDFPSGVKLGPNTRAWSEDEVEAWIQARAGNDAGGGAQ